ncbi:hypothetical protein A3B32_03010 [Candidatus Uhrbacteria bacterium RIFCSPLOWO2_01_FULL_53_9]|uniref:Uncharacterized protein n=1 Tax=Candidatus Uhrbacteria bacterium RIFCSPLOWO2_01_FULL_53_9 TaxID=1802403 RepID=A0A1F7UYY0_9BACT|nr:MAG: hypothetical protein A3B32_03010 [Candidatus Uhrbacteria bacterium RIFCSPLOWO2_01_FULL_53_9]
MGEDPLLRRLMYELIRTAELRPLLIVSVRDVPCSCRRTKHTAICAVSRAPHPQQVELEVRVGPQQFRFVSAVLLEPASASLSFSTLAAA